VREVQGRNSLLALFSCLSYKVRGQQQFHMETFDGPIKVPSRPLPGHAFRKSSCGCHQQLTTKSLVRLALTDQIALYICIVDFTCSSAEQGGVDVRVNAFASEVEGFQERIYILPEVSE
jgi:hypothetical protein